MTERTKELLVVSVLNIIDAIFVTSSCVADVIVPVCSGTIKGSVGLVVKRSFAWYCLVISLLFKIILYLELARVLAVSIGTTKVTS